MIRLVEVPVSVHVPPRIHAKESGISNRDAFSSEDLASESTMGRKTTTTGVLLTKAESTAPVTMRITRTLSSRTPATLRKPLPKARMQPLFSSPALSTNMQAMVSGAALLKAPSRSSFPKTAALSPKRPGKRMIPSENMATMSGGSHSRKNASMAKTSTPNTRNICQCTLKY